MYKIPDSMKGKVGSYDLSNFNKSTNPNKNQEIINRYLEGSNQEQTMKIKKIESIGRKKKIKNNKPVDISDRLSRLLTTKAKPTVQPAAENSQYSRKPNLNIFKARTEPAPYELEDEPEDVDNYDEENMEECEYLTTQSSLEDIVNTVNYLLDVIKGEMK